MRAEPKLQFRLRSRVGWHCVEWQTDLVILQHSVTGQTYGQSLEEHFVPFASAVFGGMQNCILIEDNVPPHRAAAVPQLKEEQLEIPTLCWP